MKFYQFSEVITDVTSKFKKVKKSDYKTTGQYKIIDQSKGHLAGYTDYSELVNFEISPIIVFGDHTRVFKYEDSPVALGADGVKALKVSPSVADPLYVFYYLRSVHIKEAGYSRHFKFLKKKKIPIPLKNGKPDINSQIRISHLLSKVERLIALRQQNLQQLDDLLKSVFLEMFGDPVRNEKGWKVRSLSSIFSVKHGFAFKSKFFEDTGPFVLLTPGNFFEEGGFRDRGTRQKYYVGETSEEYILNKNDLLVAMTEQAPGLLGSPLIVPKSERYLHNQRLGLICAKESIQEYFLFHLFNQKSIRQIIHAKATGAKVRHTSPTKIENIVVGYPPTDLQKRFVTIVDKVDSIKSHYQQSLTQLENLYNALSQKAFKGELDLSRIVVPTEQKKISQDIKPLESAAPEKDTKPTITLPAPVDLNSLNSIEGRKITINQWLDSYLEQLDGIPFSAKHFMETAQERVWELSEDDAPELGTAEYDQLKKWLFLSLESGRLVQAYDDTGNRVAVLPAKG